MFDDLELARTFLNFMVDYYALIRRHLVETNQFRLSSHGFSLLYTLQKHKDQQITMTQFADIMGITKQQLTKLVNDLEDMNYVRRRHDAVNRRLVYVELTDEGLAHLEKMLGAIIHEIIRSLDGFDENDRQKIIESSRTLSELFRKDAERYGIRE